MTAISTSFTTSFWTGATIGGASGFTSGFITGTGNAWMKGADFSQGVASGMIKGVKSGFWGAVTGGILGGVDASQDHRTFWKGKIKYDESFLPIPTRNDLIGQVEYLYPSYQPGHRNSNVIS